MIFVCHTDRHDNGVIGFDFIVIYNQKFTSQTKKNPVLAFLNFKFRHDGVITPFNAVM
jgi:hypothetical protein